MSLTQFAIRDLLIISVLQINDSATVNETHMKLEKFCGEQRLAWVFNGFMDLLAARVIEVDVDDLDRSLVTYRLTKEYKDALKIARIKVESEATKGEANVSPS